MIRKWLAVGIVLLFVETSMITNINGTILLDNPSDTIIVNSSTKGTAIFIVLIENMIKSADNFYSFDCIVVYYRAYIDGQLCISTVLRKLLNTWYVLA